MGWFKRALGFEAPDRGVVDPEAADREVGLWGDTGWSGGGIGGSGNLAGYAGVEAMRLSVVYACVNLIAGKIAQLPVKQWRVDRRTGEQIEEVPLPNWVRTPDPGHGLLGKTWIDVVTEMVTSLLLSGNAFLAFACSQPGRVREIAVLDPSQCYVDVVGKTDYVLRVNGQIPDYSVIPVRYQVPPGYVLGVSPIKACHRSFTVAEGAQEQSAGFFTRGATVPGQIIFEGEVTQEQLKRIGNNWNRQVSGVGKSHLPLFLQGAEYKPIGLSPEDAQTLATWQWADARIASHIFGVDPSLVAASAHSSNQTYANLGQRNRHLYEYALLPIIRRLEACFDWLCYSDCVLRFDETEFLADDARTRWHIYVSATKAGLLTVDEVREMAGLPPMPEPPDPAPVPGEPSGDEEQSGDAEQSKMSGDD